MQILKFASGMCFFQCMTIEKRQFEFYISETICVLTKIESLSKVNKRFRDVSVRGHVTIVQKFEREQKVTQMGRGEEEINSLCFALAV